MSSPIPEARSDISKVDNPAPTKEIKSAARNKNLKAMIDAPPAIRYSTPGNPRWRIAMKAPIHSIRWSTLAGLLVSSGTEVHNVTSKGLDRWNYVAGKGHKAFVVDEQEVVWSPEFGRLTQLRRWGRKGWSRKWSSDLVPDERGGFLLKDAATVASIGPDGKDRWRASVEGLRNLEGPFPCNGGNLFHGTRGLEGMAVTISTRGALMREIKLRRGSVVLGTSPDCTPLVWDGSKLNLLDPRGQTVWSKPLESTPFVSSMDGGVFLLSHGNERKVTAQAVNFKGETLWTTELPVEGEVTQYDLVQGENMGIDLLSLCLDVSSPCARPDSNRGPFNALVTGGKPGVFQGLLRHSQGHLNFAAFPGGGTIIASSSQPDSTELTLRDHTGHILWILDVPGRLSAGPYLGPESEVYVGTCSGWDCAPPYHLLAVTGAKPPEDPDQP